MRKFGITDPYEKKDYIGLPNTNRLKKKPDISEVELENYAQTSESKSSKSYWMKNKFAQKCMLVLLKLLRKTINWLLEKSQTPSNP